MGHSILNPINDISNIFEGTVHLFTNPAQQFNKYILPASEEALPAAAAVATGIYAPAYLGTAIAGAGGVYGTQLLTQGIGKMTSGVPPSIGDYLAGAVAAGGYQALQSGALSGLGASIVSHPMDAIGLAGLGITGYSIYAAQQAKTAQQQAAQQAQQQVQQSQQQALCQQLEGMTVSQLATGNWSAIVPNLSPNCKSTIGGNFSPKIVASLMAAEKIGQMSSSNLSSLESILSAGTINTATELFNNCVNYAASPTTFGQCIDSSYHPSTNQVSATSPYYPGTNVSQFSAYPSGTGQLGVTNITPTTTPAAVSSFPWETVLLIGGGGIVLYIGYKLIAG